MDGILNANDSDHIRNCMVDVINTWAWTAQLNGSPHVIYKAKVVQDGNAWCASVGENPMEGVFAYGDTPQQACEEFDKAWRGKK